MKKITVEEAENLQPYERTPLSPNPPFYTVEQDENSGWDKVSYFTNHSRVDKNSEGSEYVYVLKNEFMPGLLKIGYTYNTPESRAVQLFKTGVPDMFKVVYRCKCFNGMRIERAVHQQLKKYRIREDREFFKIKLEEAIQAIEQMKEQYG
jgi:hypothetical protein